MATTHAWHDMVHDMRDEMHDFATDHSRGPARQAYLVLWATFMVAARSCSASTSSSSFMNVNWEGYLATWVNDVVPGTATDAMLHGRHRRDRAPAVLVAVRAAHRRRRGRRLAGRHHRQPDRRSAATTTSRCVTSALLVGALALARLAHDATTGKETAPDGARSSA